jgi:chromosome partitioning protein
VVANRIRRTTTLSRHVLAELGTLDLPRLQSVMSEAVAYAEISFSGTMPKDGAPAEEIAALLAELHAAGGLPNLSKVGKS